MMAKLPIPLAALLVALTLGACSGDKGKSTSSSDSSAPKKFNDRISASIKHPETHRSSFEKQALSSRDADLKSKSFHTKEYGGKAASESVDKKFKIKEFSGSDKKDKELDKKDDHYNKSFTDSGKADKLGSKQFDTSKSKMADQTSHDAARTAAGASKSFTGQSKSYATKSDSVTTRAANTAIDKTAKNKKIDPGKPAYTEDEVRAMLNKG